MYKEVYYKELAHMIMEAKKSQDLQSASQPNDDEVLVQFQRCER